MHVLHTKCIEAIGSDALATNSTALFNWKYCSVSFAYTETIGLCHKQVAVSHL